MQYFYMNYHIVIPKPEVITEPISTTVDRLPITLTCEVGGDPSHYWVGWIHKNSITQQEMDILILFLQYPPAT